MGNTNNRPIRRRKFIKTAAVSGALTGLAGCTGGNGGDSSGGDGSDGSGSSGDSSGSGSGETGGTGTTTGSAEGYTLQFLANDPTESELHLEFYQDMVNQFNSNTRHTVEMNTVGTEQTNTRMRSLEAAGETPHIVQSVCQVCFQLGARNLRDIYETSTYADNISDQLIELSEEFSYLGSLGLDDPDDALYQLPFSPEFFQPVLDRDWVEAAGYTEEDVDWSAGVLDYEDDLEPLFQAMVDSNMEGYPAHGSFKPGDLEMHQFMNSQNGVSPYGYVNEEVNEEVITSPESIEIIELQKRFWDEGYWNPNSIEWGDEESTPQIWNNNLALLNNQDSGDVWGDFMSNVESDMQDGNFIYPLPFKGPSADASVTAGDFTPFFLMDAPFGSQEEVDAAVQFIEMFTTPEAQLAGTQHCGYLPGNDAAYDQDYYTQSTAHQRYFDGAEAVVSNTTIVPEEPPIHGAAEVINMEIPREMWVRILQNGEPVDQAVERAGQQINAALEDAGHR